MSWAEVMLLDGAMLIAVLIYYRNRPKPRWLTAEIRVLVWVAKALRILRRAFG